MNFCFLFIYSSFINWFIDYTIVFDFLFFHTFRLMLYFFLWATRLRSASFSSLGTTWRYSGCLRQEGKQRVRYAITVRQRISDGVKRNLLGMRRSGGSCGNTYILLHAEFALAFGATHMRTTEHGEKASVAEEHIFYSTQSSLWRLAQHTREHYVILY